MFNTCIKAVHKLYTKFVVINTQNIAGFLAMHKSPTFTLNFNDFLSSLNTVNLFNFTDIIRSFYTLSTVPIITTTKYNYLIINNTKQRG